MDDTASAVVAGFVGTSVITVLLFVGDAVTGASLQPFDAMAAFIGTDNTLVGFLFFVAVGSVPWALLYVSLGQYLPGHTDALRGMVFALVLWTGFAVGLAPGVEATSLAFFLGATLVAHLAYGFTLGAVYDYLADHEIELV